jgi:2-polyprenyl-3-methyl-5-hydroxy-6-metoxy-1,4-benzoquinol methylase
VGEVDGRRVCDLACGQGILARELDERGAALEGVDVFEKLLRIARRYEQKVPIGIHYLLDDARTLGRLESSVFDGVVCNMSWWI